MNRDEWGSSESKGFSDISRKVRLADGNNIKSWRAGKRVLASVSRYLESKLKVQVFKWELKRITRRCPGLSIVSRIIRPKQYIQGWMAHYGCGLKFDDAVRLDGWIRRRLRMCYWKQWRKPRRRIRELIKLGVGKREAIHMGMSRKSYWRLSKTLATNIGLSNAHFEKNVLICVRRLWCKIHHPATAR